MRKLFVLGLAICMVLSISACAAGQPSAEKMLETAIEINADDVTKEVIENAARAEQQYEGKYVILTSTVRRIESDFADVSHQLSNGYPLNSVRVYLSKEDLASLNVGDVITIVGELNSISAFPRIDHACFIEK